MYQKFEFDRIIARKLFEIDFIKFPGEKMREVLFINTNQKTWTELEEAIKSFSSKTKKNTDNDIPIAFSSLYQTVSVICL